MSKQKSKQRKRASRIKYIKVSKIECSSYRLTNENKPSSLIRLSDSISKHGIIEPLIVFPAKTSSKTKYTVICGQRRFKAALEAKLNSVPCVILKLSQKEALIVQLTMSLAREEANEAEEAKIINSLLNGGLSLDEIAIQTSSSPLTLNNKLLQLKSRNVSRET